MIDVNDKKYDYQMGVHYMDLIGECEKLGDYVVNVVEAHTDTKEKKLENKWLESLVFDYGMPLLQ